ncbi:HEAT repeat domain-containing protein [Bacillus sp. ISL-7]|uniref:HEAT repeat domain-containing protein n=1 Tax=Bacillus sp. ISL-7 TaxID=2819136 RepID=UPI001BEAA52B|nr:HEAT repeat domain-containing protein [Bacillus sp. ISL-7]MBT2737407.1 HEAT repeat domain-containing protein [Bacillus sp. ISL-7]
MLRNELFFLTILTITILGLLMVLLIYLTIRKAIDIKNRKAIEQYIENYQSILFTMLMEGGYSRGMIPKSVLERKATEKLLSMYSKVLEGEDEKKRLSELASMYLAEYYRKQLKSKKWSQRMNTLYHIEDFKLSLLIDDIHKLSQKKRISHEELIHTLRILALFQYENLFEMLTIHYNSLSEFEYRNILMRLEQQQFEQFILHFHKSSPPLQKAILDVISMKKEINYLSFLENIFSTYKGEIKLRALKALTEIGYVKNSDPYLELLYSTKWEERMVAAKLVGSLKEVKGISRLIELLHDQTWWVRSQAGQAICQFPNGHEILREVFETSKDAFAKDMAWEWLHKGV